VTCVRIETGYWVPKHLLIDDGLAQLDEELEHLNSAHPSARRRVQLGSDHGLWGFLPQLYHRSTARCEAGLAVAVVEDFTSGETDKAGRPLPYL
jgi:hypothetical protein